MYISTFDDPSSGPLTLKLTHLLQKNVHIVVYLLNLGIKYLRVSRSCSIESSFLHPLHVRLASTLGYTLFLFASLSFNSSLVVGVDCRFSLRGGPMAGPSKVSVGG